MPLDLVLERLRRIAGETAPRAGRLDFDWEELIGPKGLLRRELLTAVRGVAECDPTEALRDLWRLLGRPSCLQKLRLYLIVTHELRPGQEAPWAERLYRNASLLTATAGAAACAVKAKAD